MKYGEIAHFSHPQHKLRFEYSEIPFKCDGCKEVGIGTRFKCSTCDYDLHKQCALPSPTAPSPTIIRHPFYPKCTFQFMARAPGGEGARYCNACGRDVRGFVYHCRACGFDLHPCCAALPHVLEAGGGGRDGQVVRLYLYRKVGAACHQCGRKGHGWSYRSACKNYNLHVACVTEMLVDSWYEIYYGANNGGNSSWYLIKVTKTAKLCIVLSVLRLPKIPALLRQKKKKRDSWNAKKMNNYTHKPMDVLKKENWPTNLMNEENVRAMCTIGLFT